MTWTKAQDLYKQTSECKFRTPKMVWLLLERVEQLAPATPTKFSDVPCPAILQTNA